ncbi:MAG: Ig-like domain repeat protein [Planctomycetota bacterium]
MARRVAIRSVSLLAAIAWCAAGAIALADEGLAVEIRVTLAVPTSTALASDSNPSLEGDLLALKAAVSPIPAATGTVTFSIDGVVQTPAVSVDANGVATFIAGTLAVGEHVINAHYNGDGGGNPSTSADLTQTVNPKPPSIVSRIGVVGGQVGDPQEFSFVAQGAQPITYTWDFGDGTKVTTSDTTVEHTFTAPGNYTIVATAVDANGQQTSDTMTFLVVSPATPPTPNVPWTVTTATIGLNFKYTRKDLIAVAGLLTLPAGFDPTGQTIAVDFGGAKQVFTMNSNGVAQAGTNLLKLVRKLKNKKFLGGACKLGFSLKGSLGPVLADDGLTDVTTPKSGTAISVKALLTLNAVIYEADPSGLWKAKAGASGKAVLKTK